MSSNNDLEPDIFKYLDQDDLRPANGLVSTDDPLKSASESMPFVIIGYLGSCTRTTVFHDKASSIVESQSEMMIADAWDMRQDHVTTRVPSEDESVMGFWDVAEPYFEAWHKPLYRTALIVYWLC